MPVLDFKEIPAAQLGRGDQDAFELFAREVLAFIGYEIVEGPSRGPDAGKDLIISESRKGVGGETKIRWLVRCKHNATSKKAVGIGDDLPRQSTHNTASEPTPLVFSSVIIQQ